MLPQAICPILKNICPSRILAQNSRKIRITVVIWITVDFASTKNFWNKARLDYLRHEVGREGRSDKILHGSSPPFSIASKTPFRNGQFDLKILFKDIRLL